MIFPLSQATLSSENLQEIPKNAEFMRLGTPNLTSYFFGYIGWH